MRRTQAAEIMPLHGAGKTATDRRADDVDELTRQKMRGREFRTDIDQGIGRDAEFDELLLRLDLRLGEMAAIGLGDVLDLGGADTELNGGVAVLVGGADGDDLAIVDGQHRHRHMIARLGEDAGHAEFLGDKTGSHDPFLRA